MDISTLVTDRTQSDVQRVRSVAAKIINGTASDAEIAEWNAATMKGAYNYTDLNRVTAAIEALKATLEGYGYSVPGYRRIELPRESVGDGTRLPAGFKQVEYIESSGTQYIDTGYNPNNNTRTVLDIENTYVGQAALFGARDSSSNNSNLLWAISATQYRSDYFLVSGGTNALVYGTVGTVAGRYTIDKNKNVCTANGVTMANNVVTFSCAYSMFLFTLSNAGTPNSKMARMKLYACQIYDNGTLVRDYIPCVTIAGEDGLYDLIAGEFYGNAGTGSFAIGPVVEWEPLPDGDDTEKDPYLWYESDIPTPTLMTDYLANVSAIRSVLDMLPTTPAVPADMEQLTTDKANAIERILADINTLIHNMIAAWFYSGEIYSGEV